MPRDELCHADWLRKYFAKKVIPNSQAERSVNPTDSWELQQPLQQAHFAQLTEYFEGMAPRSFASPLLSWSGGATSQVFVRMSSLLEQLAYVLNRVQSLMTHCLAVPGESSLEPVLRAADQSTSALVSSLQGAANALKALASFPA